MIEKFRKYLESESVSENTVNIYVSDIVQFLKFFKDKFDEEIIELEHILVTEYIKELKNQSVKAVTINRKVAALNKYNQFLIEEGIQEDIVIKPKDYIKLQPKLTAPYSPSEKEILKLKLIAKDNKRDLAIITTFANGGVRVSELIHIEINDLNFESKSITIRGKGNKVRMILMADVMYDALQDYLEERKQNGTLDKNKYLFIGRQEVEKNKPLHRSTINAILDKYENLLNIYIYPHVLRDYFCTEAHNKRALTEVQIAALAGHNSLNTTRKYIKLQQKDLLEGVNKI